MRNSWLENLVAGIRKGDSDSLQSFADYFGPYFLVKLLTAKNMHLSFAKQLAFSCVQTAIQQLIFEEGEPETIIHQAFETTFSDWIRQLQNDFHEAGTLQSRLFPRPAPSLYGLEIAARSRPARHVNGDLHDFISRPADTVIALVDASGKGVAAGLYAAIAGGFLRGFAAGEESPAKMLTLLDSAVTGTSTTSMYLTATILSWSPHLSQVSFASAGFPAPLISQGGIRLNSGFQSGLPIGLALNGSRQKEYPEVQLPLNPGDWLALFSDGVSEQPNSADEEYGVDCLWEIIQANLGKSAEHIVEKVFANLDHHAGSRPRQDDQTLIFVRAVSANSDYS